MSQEQETREQDTRNQAASEQAIQLYLKLETGDVAATTTLLDSADLTAFSRLVSHPEHVSRECLLDHDQQWLFDGADPDAYPHCCDYPGGVWSGSGLESVARLRDKWPDLRWILRIDVERQETRYSFPQGQDDATFKCYMMDTGTINAYVAPGEGNQRIEKVLERAQSLEFDRIWLHSLDAESRGRGLALELLEKARRFWRKELWLSGGVSSVVHLENLRKQGEDAAEVVILPSSWALEQDRQALMAALAPEESSQPEDGMAQEVGLPRRESA